MNNRPPGATRHLPFLFVALLGIVGSAWGNEPPHHAGEIAELIHQLDDDSFRVREQASRQLLRIGEPALAALRIAARHPSTEVRQRAKSLIERIQRFQLYTVSRDGGLFELEIAKNQVKTRLVARLGAPFNDRNVRTEGLAAAPDGSLYASVVFVSGAETVSRLYRISPFTGAAKRIGDIATAEVDGLDFGPDGKLYGAISSGFQAQTRGLRQIVTIDTNSAAVSPAVNEVTFTDLDALAFGSDGRALVTNGRRGLYSVDPAKKRDLSQVFVSDEFSQFLRASDEMEGLCVTPEGVVFGLCDEECTFLVRLDPRSKKVTRIGDLSFGALCLAAPRSSTTDSRTAKERALSEKRRRQDQAELLEGTWNVIFREGIGGDLATITFSEGAFRLTYESGAEFEGRYYVRRSEARRLAIDIVHPGGRTGYILARVEGDTLTYCGSDDPRARPTEFIAKEGDGRFFFILRRGKPTGLSKDGGAAVPPRIELRWRNPVANDPKDERVLESIRASHVAKAVPPITRLRPRLVGETVLARSTDRLLGIDFTTGKRIWEYPWVSEEAPRASHVARDELELLRRSEIEKRIWRDGVYAQLCSDGKRAFVITTQPLPSVPRATGIVINKHHNAADRLRTLVALDVESQGKLSWNVGGKSGWDEPKLAGSDFLGIAVGQGGLLYSLVEQQGHLRLAALAATTGKLQWSLDVADLGDEPPEAALLRHLVGAVPIVNQGVVICPTQAGEIVAVDLQARKLVWKNRYTSAPRILRESAAVASTQPVSWWAYEHQLIAGDHLLLTPADSAKLYCLDVDTGRIRWSVEAEKAVYCAGVKEETVVLVEANQLVGLQLNNGLKRWVTMLIAPDKGTVGGLGYFSDGGYCVPLTSSEIVHVELDRGRIRQRIRVPNPPGNLAALDRKNFLSQSAKSISLYTSE